MSKQNKPPNSALRENSYAGAAQQDGKEALWVELETLLRRCIRGLSLLSESTNAVVRTHTESLRRATHDGLDLHHIRDDLQQLADEIGAAVAAVFGAQPQQQAAFSTRPAPVLNEALLQLIERLDLPLEMNAACESLKQRLALPLSDDELPKVLELIAALVTEMRAHVDQERGDIESFLRQLTERLREIELYLQGEEALREHAMQRAREFDATLEEQVHEIKNAMQSSSDLAQLKLDIEARVEAIRLHAEEYCRAELEHGLQGGQQRNTSAEQQIKALTTRLQILEAESGELRERILHERKQAMHDALTGVFNRRAYKERMELEYARWKRYQSPLILMVWDIDRFKVINDTYGHKAGDKALITIAHLLRDQIRETDFLARYGGEEFVVLMPETTVDHALAVAETLRGSIANCNFHFRGKLVPITISGGSAELGDKDTPESLFERADAALYEAKKSGGNQCVFKPATDE